MEEDEEEVGVQEETGPPGKDMVMDNKGILMMMNQTNDHLVVNDEDLVKEGVDMDREEDLVVNDEDLKTGKVKEKVLVLKKEMLKGEDLEVAHQR